MNPKEIDFKICKHCGKSFIRGNTGRYEGPREFERRVYCSQQCARHRQKREELTPEEVKQLRYYYTKMSLSFCAAKLHLRRETLMKLMEKYEEEHGPILQVPQIVKEVDIKTEYSIAWTECAQILNEMKNQSSQGRAALTFVDRKIQEQCNRIERAEIQEKFSRLA